MSTITFIIPTTDFQIQLDEEDPFLQELKDTTYTINYQERVNVVKGLLGRISPYFDAFMQQGKQRVFDARRMRFYTVDDFLTDAAQCAFINSTLPAKLAV